ncbi:MAG: hypothetical protein P4L56_22270 [Candidatus Sulfopaludibacter sp.]|nr:hypothetical protein [Candidatus Sulfopaludibacter sp.]
MKSTLGQVSGNNSAGNDFVYTEFFLNNRDPLPPARFGNRRFMWGCIALTSAFVAWMLSRGA